MDDPKLDYVISDGLKRSVAGHVPADRWDQIRAVLVTPVAPPPPARRLRWLVVATALLLIASAASLLVPPVRAATAEGVRNLFRILWQGSLRGTPTAVLTLPDIPVTESLLPPAPGIEAHRVDDLEEAESLAGFALPILMDDRVRMGPIRVTTMTTPPGGESRVVEIQYFWADQTYFLSALAAFANDEQGILHMVPGSEVLAYSMPGEEIATIQTVDLGGAEALCLKRDFGSTGLITHCQWLMDGLMVHLTGPEEVRVIELAHTVLR